MSDFHLFPSFDHDMAAFGNIDDFHGHRRDPLAASASSPSFHISSPQRATARAGQSAYPLPSAALFQLNNQVAAPASTSPGSRRKRKTDVSTPSHDARAEQVVTPAADSGRKKNKSSPQSAQRARVSTLHSAAQASVSPDEKEQKGLRHFSLKVCEKLESKATTTYNEVADELVAEMQAEMAIDPLAGKTQCDEKNIRRRVYDALNVLMAIGAISKDKKTITWAGYPKRAEVKLDDSETIDNLQEQINARTERLDRKSAAVRELLTQAVSVFQLIRRNASAQPQHENKLALPFVLVRAPATSSVHCDISDDRQNVQFSLSESFELIDDKSALRLADFHRVRPENVTASVESNSKRRRTTPKQDEKTQVLTPLIKRYNEESDEPLTPQQKKTVSGARQFLATVLPAALVDFYPSSLLLSPQSATPARDESAEPADQSASDAANSSRRGNRKRSIPMRFESDDQAVAEARRKQASSDELKMAIADQLAQHQLPRPLPSASLHHEAVLSHSHAEHGSPARHKVGDWIRHTSNASNNYMAPGCFSPNQNLTAVHNTLTSRTAPAVAPSGFYSSPSLLGKTSTVAHLPSPLSAKLLHAFSPNPLRTFATHLTPNANLSPAARSSSSVNATPQRPTSARLGLFGPSAAILQSTASPMSSSTASLSSALTSPSMPADTLPPSSSIYSPLRWSQGHAPSSALQSHTTGDMLMGSPTIGPMASFSTAAVATKREFSPAGAANLANEWSSPTR